MNQESSLRYVYRRYRLYTLCAASNSCMYFFFFFSFFRIEVEKKKYEQENK